MLNYIISTLYKKVGKKKKKAILEYTENELLSIKKLMVNKLKQEMCNKDGKIEVKKSLKKYWQIGNFFSMRWTMKYKS